MSNIRTIQTPLYMDARLITLDAFITQAKRDMEERICTLYSIANKTRNEDLKETLYTTRFYSSFHQWGRFNNHTTEMPLYTFHINSKNVNFETTIPDLKEWYSGMSITPEDTCSNPPITRCIKDIPHWEDLFGKGEFPYMVINVFRLGNTEYFCYSITR